MDDCYRITSVGLPQNLALPFLRQRADVPLAAKGNWTTRWFALDLRDTLGVDTWLVRFKFAGDNNSKLTLDVNYTLGLSYITGVGGNISITGTAQ